MHFPHYSLNQVKECLYLGIDDDEVYGCQIMQWEKHKWMTFISQYIQMGQSPEDKTCYR